MMDFAHITPCGECCAGCGKKAAGECGGCIETDGKCEEWAQSGICPVYACAREHDVPFCGVCPEFPCSHLPMKRWRPNCEAELRQLAQGWRQWHNQHE